MKPSAVLQDIQSRQHISFFEAERGVLACVLRALREQLDRDPSCIRDVFHDESYSSIEPVVRQEFRSILARYTEEQEVDRESLQKAADGLASRLDMEEWDEDVIASYREDCKQILSKSVAKPARKV